jgi:L-threonylcarbamoyladenylate synthase
METQVLAVDPNSPDRAAIERAAAVLRAGGLVAFPTETVYGLGADALDAAAVGRIFAAKGRPAHNPLIVHVADEAGARAVAGEWPAAAARLAARFWPGPLTLVVPKAAAVPDVVTAGGLTVAVRVPANPVALALLRAAGVPVAAPSANRSSRLSPTRAEHVLRGLAGRIDLVLDGGPTAGGIESTVLDVTAHPPRLLRPGLIEAAALEAVVGPVVRPRAPRAAGDAPLPSPGILPRHYAPTTSLECVEGSGRVRVEGLAAAGRRVGWLTLGPPDGAAPPHTTVVSLPAEPAGYAAGLYAALHALDELGLERIVVALPPDTPAWLAVRDRLRRASA